MVLNVTCSIVLGTDTFLKVLVRCNPNCMMYSKCISGMYYNFFYRTIMFLSQSLLLCINWTMISTTEFYLFKRSQHIVLCI